MRGEHRFFRVHAGRPAFAAVAVEATPGVRAIVWGAAASRMRALHGAAVESGVRCALDAHERRAGAPCSIEIVSVEDVPVDTRADAVFCAAAAATWNALGGAADDVRFEADERGAWSVTVDAPPGFEEREGAR